MARMAASLEALSPLKVLARGYAITRDEQGHVVSDASQLQESQQVSVVLGKGSFEARVTSVQEDIR
jgi:exodeoxyribonuclease VII large subunit